MDATGMIAYDCLTTGRSLTGSMKQHGSNIGRLWIHMANLGLKKDNFRKIPQAGSEATLDAHCICRAGRPWACQKGDDKLGWNPLAAMKVKYSLDCYSSPQLCVGFLFLILYPAAAASLLRLLRRPSSHSHNSLSYTIFHTQLCHTPSFTTLCHTPSFTHNFVTHNFGTDHLSHTHNFDTHLSQHLSHTNFVTHQLSPSFTHHLCHTPSFTLFCAQRDFAW